MEKIRVFTAFSGYDSQCLALRRIGVPFELVGWSEIDAFVIKAHNALFPESTDRNYGDISQIDWDKVPDFDLFTYSSPCQDFSQAGRQRGGQKGSGTRSSLLWECERAIAAKRPKYLLMENVAALVSQKFIKLFQSWMTVLEGYGYKNFAQVLNAKDYGVPQNRERIFLVSIRVDDRTEWENVHYHFPKPQRLERRLRDILEAEVDEKYYLSDSRLEGVLLSTQKEADRGNGFAFEPKDGNDVASTIQTSTTRKTDNYIKMIGKLSSSQNSRVISADSISYSITNGEKDGSPKILCSRRTAEGKQLRREGIERFADRELQPKDDDTSNAITTVQKDNLLLEPQEVLGWSRDSKGNIIGRHPVEVANTVTASKRANTQNYVSCAVRTRSYCGQPATVEQGSENYANSLTSVQKDSMVMEQIPINTDSEVNARTINTHYQEMNMQSVTDKAHDGYGYVRTAVRQQFRIRKLTERECFRLMGVDDSDIDAIQASKVSRSQQYKLAGNSIVVDVLAAIFDKMFLHPQSDDAQLKLF